MKIVIFLLFLAVSQVMFSQSDTTKSYIYLTYDEYIQNKPSVILDHENGDVIKYSFPAGMQTRLKTKSDNIVKIYKPGEIWGYKEKGVLFRQFSNYKQKDLGWEFKCYFKVIYNKEVVIYSVGHIGNVAMAEDDYSLYYYSIDLNSDIKKMKDDNLNSDFSNKPEIIDLIKKFTVK